MTPPLNAAALEQLFAKARSQNAWRTTPVSAAQMHAIYDLTKMGPTSANCSPARFVFVASEAGKAKLAPLAMETNQAKILQAPVCVIIANDMKFYERIPALFPHHPEARDWFTGSEEFAEISAMRNGTLQGAYFMLAVRALGFDVGPMSGFDNSAVDAAFFPDGQIKSNFLCCIGVGEPRAVFERLPRLNFDEACQIV